MEEAEKIGIRELRQHASRYVAMAKAGMRVPVTDRGKLVAWGPTTQIFVNPREKLTHDYISGRFG